MMFSFLRLCGDLWKRHEAIHLDNPRLLFRGGTIHAQQEPAADVSAGYSYFGLGGSNSGNFNGLNASAAYNRDNVLGLVGDLSMYRGSLGGMNLTTVTYMVGPRFAYRGSTRFVPFLQGLFGGSHHSAPIRGSENPFTFSFGGGGRHPHRYQGQGLAQGTS